MASVFPFALCALLLVMAPANISKYYLSAQPAMDSGLPAQILLLFDLHYKHPPPPDSFFACSLSQLENKARREGCADV